MAKVKASSSRMVVRAYPVIAAAVESGVRYGITRLFKHYNAAAMTEDEMRDRVETMVDAIMNDICEAVEFRDDDEAA